jgi:hypothetical protein
VTRPMAPGPVPGTARGPKCQDHKSHYPCLAPHTAKATTRAWHRTLPETPWPIPPTRTQRGGSLRQTRGTLVPARCDTHGEPIPARCVHSSHGWCLARDVAVTNLCRGARRGSAKRLTELPSMRGAPPSLSRSRRVVPHHHAWQQQGALLPGRRRSPRLPPPTPTRDAPVRLAPPRPLPDGQSLPPRRRDARAEPLGRHARSQRRVRPRLQRGPRTLRPRLRQTLFLATDRDGRASRDRAGVHPAEPRRGRLRCERRRLALDMDSRPSPSDRFGDACRTTPTS